LDGFCDRLASLEQMPNTGNQPVNKESLISATSDETDGQKSTNADRNYISQCVASPNLVCRASILWKGLSRFFGRLTSEQTSTCVLVWFVVFG
jgi:hypothetical protein